MYKPKLKIVNETGLCNDTKVLIDGVQVPGVTEITFEKINKDSMLVANIKVEMPAVDFLLHECNFKPDYEQEDIDNDYSGYPEDEDGQ